MRAGVPSGAHEQPAARREPAVLGLPCLDVLDLEEEVRVLRDAIGNVDDRCGCDQPGGRYGGDILPAPPADPVVRSVEVRAGVLAGAEVVPVPGRTAVVVRADLLELERGGLSELLGQLERRGTRREWSGEVDDPDRAGLERPHEPSQNRHVHLRVERISDGRRNVGDTQGLVNDDAQPRAVRSQNHRMLAAGSSVGGNNGAFGRLRSRKYPALVLSGPTRSGPARPPGGPDDGRDRYFLRRTPRFACCWFFCPNKRQQVFDVSTVERVAPGVTRSKRLARFPPSRARRPNSGRSLRRFTAGWSGPSGLARRRSGCGTRKWKGALLPSISNV